MKKESYIRELEQITQQVNLKNNFNGAERTKVQKIFQILNNCSTRFASRAVAEYLIPDKIFNQRYEVIKKGNTVIFKLRVEK